MVHVEGLLHLSGIALAVTIAYVGLDKIRWEENVFFKHLEEVEKDIAASLLRFGIQTDGKFVNAKASCKLFPLFCLRLKLFALCHVAQARVQMGFWGRVWHWFHIQRHAPLLPYIRSRWERRIIRLMAVTALSIFLYVSALATWQMTSFPWPGCDVHNFLGYNLCNYVWSRPVEDVVPYFYGISAAILLWVCVTGAASQRLQNIKARCQLLVDTVTTRVNEMDNFVTKTLPPNGDDADAHAKNTKDNKPAATGGDAPVTPESQK
jgi:hypothetical protein